MLRRAIGRMLWVFPVYRTYGTGSAAPDDDAAVRFLPNLMMVHLSEESSNLLFDTLAEWTEILKTTSLGRRMNDNIPPESAQSRAKRKR